MSSEVFPFFDGNYLEIRDQVTPFLTKEEYVTRHKQSSTMRFLPALRCGTRGVFGHPNAAPR